MWAGLFRGTDINQLTTTLRPGQVKWITAIISLHCNVLLGKLWFWHSCGAILAALNITNSPKCWPVLQTWQYGWGATGKWPESTECKSTTPSDLIIWYQQLHRYCWQLGIWKRWVCWMLIYGWFIGQCPMLTKTWLKLIEKGTNV